MTWSKTSNATSRMLQLRISSLTAPANVALSALLDVPGERLRLDRLIATFSTLDGASTRLCVTLVPTRPRCGRMSSEGKYPILHGETSAVSILSGSRRILKVLLLIFTRSQ